MQSCGIAEVCIIHSKLLSLLIHQLRKIRLRTTDRIRQCNTALGPRWQHRTIQQIDHPDILSRLKTCLCRILLIQPRKHLIRQCNLLIQILQILNGNDHRHDLRHRSRINLLITIDLSQDLTSPRLHQDCIRTVDPTDIHFLQNRLLKLLKPLLHALIPSDHDNQRTDNDHLNKHTSHNPAPVSPRITSSTALFPSPASHNNASCLLL